MFKKLPTSILVLFLILLLLYIYTYEKKENKIVSPLGKNHDANSLVDKVLRAFETKSKLQNQMENFLQDKDGTYAIYIKNLNTQETVEINSAQVFSSASLYKLWVAGEAYNQIKNGKLKKTDGMSYKRGDLYKIFDLEVEEDKKDEEISFSVENALKQMIVVSDNDSALMLSARLGNNNITNFIKNNGFTHSSVESTPSTSPRDIGIFFEKLYKGEIVDKDSSDQLLILLKSQRINDRIPKYLPDNVDTAHKTGELDTFKHDAGIVYGKEPYVLVVLTDTPNPQSAAELIATISKEVYNYFEKD